MAGSSGYSGDNAPREPCASQIPMRGVHSVECKRLLVDCLRTNHSSLTMKLAALWQAALLGCLSFPSIVASRASQFVNEIPEIASSGNQEATHQLYTSSRHPVGAEHR